MPLVKFEFCQAKYTSTALTAPTASHNISTNRNALFIINCYFTLHFKNTVGIKFLICFEPLTSN